MNLWLIKGNSSSGKLGEIKKFRSPVMTFLIVDIEFPYHRAAMELQLVGQRQDKETLNGNKEVLLHLGLFYVH